MALYVYDYDYEMLSVGVLQLLNQPVGYSNDSGNSYQQCEESTGKFCTTVHLLEKVSE